MVVAALSQATGIGESALSLLIGLFLAYPLAYIYRQYLLQRSEQERHLYNLACGVALGYFCYGTDLIYSFISIVVTYAAMMVLPRNTAATFSFVFNMAYLLGGYYLWSSEEGYDIDWTTAQSVLCLRLIGFSMDYMDGGKPEAQLEADLKETALKEIPPFMEVLGFCYYYTAFYIGPQFPFNKYKKYVTGKLIQPVPGTKELPSPVAPAMQVLLLGLLYLAGNQIGAIFIPFDYIKTAEFRANDLLYKIVYCGLACYVMLARYLGVWLIGEGAGILSGLGFVKYTPEGKPVWNGCANVVPSIYETSTSMKGIVESFNINTNAWAKRYVFKRLRFLNNKDASLIGTAMFLGLWHGTAPGYLICFALEFPAFDSEARADKMMKNYYDKLAAGPEIFRYLHFLAGVLYRILVLGFPLTAFTLKSWKPILELYGSVYYWYLICYALVIIADRTKIGYKIFGTSRSKPPTKQQ